MRAEKGMEGKRGKIGNERKGHYYRDTTHEMSKRSIIPTEEEVEVEALLLYSVNGLRETLEWRMRSERLNRRGSCHCLFVLV